jgi:hypothetical protein
MERYHYFASSCRQFGFGARSLSETMQDERENDGALATILDVLERIHTIFFDPDDQKPLSSRDVRQVDYKTCNYPAGSLLYIISFSCTVVFITTDFFHTV